MSAVGRGPQRSANTRTKPLNCFNKTLLSLSPCRYFVVVVVADGVLAADDGGWSATAGGAAATRRVGHPHQEDDAAFGGPPVSAAVGAVVVGDSAGALPPVTPCPGLVAVGRMPDGDTLETAADVAAPAGAVEGALFEEGGMSRDAGSTRQ